MEGGDSQGKAFEVLHVFNANFSCQQAFTLEYYNVRDQLFNHVQLLELFNSHGLSEHQAPLSMRLLRQEY